MSSNYWQLRDLEERDKLLDLTIDAINIKLQKRYLAASKRIIKEMESMYLTIMKEPNPLISHLYAYGRYYSQLTQLNEELTKLGSDEITILDDKLLKLYTNNAKLVDKQIGLYSKVNIEVAKRAITTAWVGDGLNYSDRIWKSKDKLIETIQQGLVDCIQTGMPVEKFTKVLMDRFSVSYSEASRLARTECSYVYNRSALDRYKEAGIEEVEWLSASDSRTCGICKELNHKVYQLGQEPTLPAHCNCRCCWIPVIPKK